MLQREQQNNIEGPIELFTQTQVAFANCEANGIKIDVPYLKQAIVDTKQQLLEIEHRIKATEVWKRWFEIYGSNASFTVRQQLARVLFRNIPNAHPKNMGYDCVTFTETGQPQISEGSLERMPNLGEFAKDYALWMSLTKMLTTNLKGIEACLDPNGFIHPSFSLFSVVSYRTSSSGINFQNIPNHDPILGGIVRKCFIPRAPDRHFVELDYSGAEVRANASINRDPTLMDSINHGLDFHKSIAAMAYKLPESEITKPLRQSVKGPYTFAAFYGSYWKGIAEGLWDAIEYGDLTLKDGKPLKQHLAEQGITELGDSEHPAPNSYYAHIIKTDEWFWKEKFKVYGQWKDRAWREYLKNGYVDTPDGFRCGGVFSKNLITNIPAQCSASHCLLWSFVQLEKTLREKGFKALICGQIHDSIVLDIPHDELDDVLMLANDIMTQQLPQVFKWLAVPMEIEADVAPMGKSWFEKQAYPIPAPA